MVRQGFINDAANPSGLKNMNAKAGLFTIYKSLISPLAMKDTWLQTEMLITLKTE